MTERLKKLAFPQSDPVAGKSGALTELWTSDCRMTARQADSGARLIGTHRLADDKLWAEAMSLGASDICEPRNDDVVRSLLDRRTRHAAA